MSPYRESAPRYSTPLGGIEPSQARYFTGEPLIVAVKPVSRTEDSLDSVTPPDIDAIRRSLTVITGIHSAPTVLHNGQPDPMDEVISSARASLLGQTPDQNE